MTGANVGSPGNSTELSQHETQISNITYYNNCCPPVIPPVIFQTTECCRKAHFGGAILSPFFFVNRRKAIFDVVTGSPIFFFIRQMSPKFLFLHKTSSETISYGAGNSKFLKTEIGWISDFGRTSASQQKMILWDSGN